MSCRAFVIKNYSKSVIQLKIHTKPMESDFVTIGQSLIAKYLSGFVVISDCLIKTHGNGIYEKIFIQIIHPYDIFQSENLKDKRVHLSESYLQLIMY